ncbi:MAG: penicillin-binding protein 2 [Myxococcota bacterium]|nr:penicillin-binding protein 2 [Myxococcota bacterium]
MELSHDLPARAGLKFFRTRLFVAVAIVVLATLVLGGRLYWLQLLRGEELANRGRSNFVQGVVVSHDRGIIYDRDGQILVDNRASFDLAVTPYFLGDAEQVLSTLTTLGERLKVDSEEVKWFSEQVKKQRGLNRFRQLVWLKDLNPAQMDFVETERSLLRLDGVEIVDGRRRAYPNGSLGAHILGYVNEIDRGWLERERARGNPGGYRKGAILGRAGLERELEMELRGRDGSRNIMVDAKGRLLSQSAFGDEYLKLGEEEPEPGNNLYLTIDRELQAMTEAAFDGAAGSVVVMDIKTGAILTMVAVPSFEPNLVSGALEADEKRVLDENLLKPWLNRSIQGLYAPGSTFKIVTSLAGLALGAITPEEKIYCPGHYKLGRRRWRCHKDAGHGYVNLKDALKVSCDVYYYDVSMRVGIDKIAEWGRALGLGQKTKLGLPNEKSGVMPDRRYHNRAHRRSGGYQKGMALNTSIGQGDVLVTPLQLAVAYGAIVNGGRVVEPHLVNRIETADKRVTRTTLQTNEITGLTSLLAKVEGEAPKIKDIRDTRILRTLDVDPEILQFIKDGLVAVAQEPGGTAYWRRSRTVTMGGKTGTAQVVRLGTEREKAEDMAYVTRDHAWFVGFAPADSPRIVVVVLNEHSGHGGSKAAPIAVKVIDGWERLRTRQMVARDHGPRASE